MYNKLSASEFSLLFDVYNNECFTLRSLIHVVSFLEFLMPSALLEPGPPRLAYKEPAADT